MGANVNINLQKSNNYMVVLGGNAQFNSKDVTFYMKNFKIPSMTINPADVDVNQNIIHFPSQGRLDYEELSLDLLIDDNLKSWLELAQWMNRLKDPEKLLQSHIEGFNPHTYKRGDQSIKKVLESSNQFPIEYKDMDIFVTDRNHQVILRFNFVDTWISNLSGVDMDAQGSDYLTIHKRIY